MVFAGIVLLGIIFQELGEEWETFEYATLFIPMWLSNHGIPETILDKYLWLETLWVNILLPLVLFIVAGTVSTLMSHKRTIADYIKLYGVAIIPLVFSAHFSKMINKFNAKFNTLCVE